MAKAPVDVRKDVNGLRHIYGNAKYIEMVREYGKHAGTTFKHKFTDGNRVMGAHGGRTTIVTEMPDGRVIKKRLKYNALVIISDEKDLWNDYIY